MKNTANNTLFFLNVALYPDIKWCTFMASLHNKIRAINICIVML